MLARLIDPATRLGKVLGHVIPVMTPAIALAADPDAALVRLERVAEAVGQRSGPADALATDPKAALAPRAPRRRQPRSPPTLLVADPERIRALADGVIHADDAQADLVRVVARYAGRELSPVAPAPRSPRWGTGSSEKPSTPPRRTVPLAVIGMGKLGAREPNFASDLDVVFVYEGEGAERQQAAITAAEKVMRNVRDAGWEPDADLRPEGRNGPLARSMAGFLEYWERYAEPWEFQSLLRARAVAGDQTLGKRFSSNAARPRVPARRHHDRPRRRDPPHARTDRARAR